MASDLLTRDEFRERVFARDGHRCVLCGAGGKLDAHHILERRLWPDGGYYLDNGAALCEPCHYRAETTEVSVEAVRLAARIKSPRLPEHLYPDTVYDKWGNACVGSVRYMGELAEDESVRKVLSAAGVVLSDQVKYPRTYHLPWSPGLSDDDKVQRALWGLEGREVVVTEKLDGENTTIYPGGRVHARSLEYHSRIDRDRVKALAATVGWDLAPRMRVCGENVWAQHSIAYTHLPHFFMTFSIWDGLTALAWDDVVEWCALLGLRTVPVMYRGVFDPEAIGEAHAATVAARPDPVEGYVVRPAGAFQLREFSSVVLKYVRKGHVQTHAHWTRNIQPNPFLQGGEKSS